MIWTTLHDKNWFSYSILDSNIQLRADIFIFSTMQKTCIIIGLRRLSGESMEVWHQKKFEKYLNKI